MQDSKSNFKAIVPLIIVQTICFEGGGERSRRRDGEGEEEEEEEDEQAEKSEAAQAGKNIDALSKCAQK